MNEECKIKIIGVFWGKNVKIRARGKSGKLPYQIGKHYKSTTLKVTLTNELTDRTMQETRKWIIV